MKLEAPAIFEDLAEGQRVRDVKHAEHAIVRHKAREPLAPGFPITVRPGLSGWAAAVEWLAKQDKKVPFEKARMVTFYRDTSGGGDAWHVEAASETGVIFRDIVPSDRFYTSWMTSEPKEK